MNKRNILTILILFLTATAVTVKTYAEDVEQVVVLSVQPFVSVEKQSTSKDSATVDAYTGIHEGLRIVYDIKTNGTDSDYDFTLSAKINSASGEVSAYGNDGSLLFARIDGNEPTLEAIANAKIGGNNNKNVIAYPTNASITSPMTITFVPNHETYGSCYVIKINDGTEATLTHNVLGTPVSGTYNVGQDEAGQYQTTIYLTVTPKN